MHEKNSLICLLALPRYVSFSTPWQELNAQVKAHEEELAKIAARQTELKAVLYGKFGTSINLED